MLSSPLNKIALTILIYLVTAHTALSNDALPIFHIDTTDKTRLQIGQALGDAVKQQFPDIEARYDAYLHTLLTQAQFNQLLQQRVKPLRQQVTQHYQDEISGITSRWQLFGHDQLGDNRLSLNEYWTFLLLPDLGHPEIRGSAFGVWQRASATDSPIVGYNLDWPADANLKGLQALTVYAGPDGGIVNIGFAGSIGTLSGFNQSGLFLAQIASPLSQTESASSGQGYPVVFALRQALETAHTNRQARQQLEQTYNPTSHNILMADRTYIQVLEKPQNTLGRIRNDNSPYRANKSWNKTNQIAAVNCYTLLSSPNNCTHSNDNFRWQRLRQLANFDHAHPAEVSDIISIMLDTTNHYQAIFNRHTLYSMVFTPEDGTLHLYHTPSSGQDSARPVMQAFRNLLPTGKPSGGWQPIIIMLTALGAFILIATVYYFEFHRKRR
jgi:hypothetical protein